MKSYKISYIFILFAVTVFFTSCGIEARLRKANNHYSMGEYSIAGNLYKSVYSRLPYKKKEKKAEVAFKQAECYRKISYYRAEAAYQNAIRYKYSNDTVFLRLAQVQMRNGKYSEAGKNFTTFLQNHPDSKLALSGLEATKYALDLKSNPTRFVVKVSKEFNISRSSNFSPAFYDKSADAVYFTSNRKFDKKNVVRKNNGVSGQPNNHIFSSKKDSKGKWEKVELAPGEINTLNDEGVASFTADGRSMFITRSNTVEDKGNGTVIMEANRAGGTWGAPLVVKLFNDSTISVAHPAVSPDGETLYFVSDAPGGFGENDIWKATKIGAVWGAIENLGPEINTEGNEMFPTVRADGTLYFSSDGKPGMGGLDIFRASLNNQQKWVVENVGSPVNSFNDDFGMAFAGTSNNGFFSSNRDDYKGYDKIWSFELPELEYVLSGKITDKQGALVPEGRIKIIGSDGENAKIQAKGDGSYRFKMKPGVEYVMMASAKGYLNQKGQINTLSVSDRKSETFNVDFQLSPISKPVQMSNVFYEFGRWTLTPESEKALQPLVKLLNDNPNITIELSSHTDYKGNNAENKILSEKRAQTVVDYLIKAGISKDRLTAVGYGEEQPFTIDEATAKKYPFLKSGTVLSEEIINALTPEQQEIANQINRRTEFKVVKTTYNLY